MPTSRDLPVRLVTPTKSSFRKFVNLLDGFPSTVFAVCCSSSRDGMSAMQTSAAGTPTIAVSQNIQR